MVKWSVQELDIGPLYTCLLQTGDQAVSPAAAPGALQCSAQAGVHQEDEEDGGDQAPGDQVVSRRSGG